jgi:cobalt/nickel transport system permease protein
MSLPVEHLSCRGSLFARIDPRWKLAALSIAAAATAALRGPILLAAALALALLLAALARLPAQWFRRRMQALLLVLSPFLIILPLTVDQGGSALELFGLRFSLAGVIAAAALCCKTMAIVVLMLIVLATAPLHVTLRAARQLGAPSLLVLLTQLCYRYVFLLLDELNRLRVALRVRGFRNRANLHSYRTIGQATGTLLVRGAERGERVSQAMRCRGFDGAFRALESFHTSRADVILFAAIVALFAGLAVADFLN